MDAFCVVMLHGNFFDWTATAGPNPTQAIVREWVNEGWSCIAGRLELAVALSKWIGINHFLHHQGSTHSPVCMGIVFGGLGNLWFWCRALTLLWDKQSLYFTEFTDIVPLDVPDNMTGCKLLQSLNDLTDGNGEQCATAPLFPVEKLNSASLPLLAGEIHSLANKCC